MDLTDSDRKKKASRSTPTYEDDDEERMIIELNNSYTFEF